MPTTKIDIGDGATYSLDDGYTLVLVGADLSPGLAVPCECGGHACDAPEEHGHVVYAPIDWHRTAGPTWQYDADGDLCAITSDGRLGHVVPCRDALPGEETARAARAFAYDAEHEDEPDNCRVDAE